MNIRALPFVRRCDHAPVERIPEGETVEANRIDRGSLRAMRLTDEGFILAEGFFAKPGILVYRDSAGNEWRELVPESTLHDAASLGTIGQKPITLEHPAQDVSPENISQFEVGNVSPDITIVEGGFVRVELSIRRADAIKAVRDGKVELSPGYLVQIEATAGVDPVFGRYDAIQRNRRYNHLAIVEAARGGADIRLRSDSDLFPVPAASATLPPSSKDRVMNPLLLTLLAGIGISRSDAEGKSDEWAFDQIKPCLDSASADKGRVDSLGADLVTVKGQLATVTGERDTLKASADSAPSDEQRRADSLAFHAERTDIEAIAAVHGLELTDELKKVDNDGLKKAVCLHVHGDSLDADAAPAYFSAAYDMLPKTRADAGGQRGPGWNRAGLRPRTDDGNSDDPVKPPPRRVDAWTNNMNREFEANKPGAVTTEAA